MIEHGGNVYKFSRILNRDISEILDFSANINPLGFPSGLKEYLYSVLDSIVYYPDPDYVELRKKIGDYIGINLENVIVGNGAIEIISLCIQTVGKPAIIPIPTFSEYARICRMNNLGIEYFPMRGSFELEIDALINRLRSRKYGMLILCNPNNPTGRLIEISSIRVLLEETVKLGIFLILDEAFIEFTEDYPKHSAISLINSFPNLCVIRCFTKFFGLPGMRLGYGVASEEFINRMRDIALPWSVNILADLAGRYVLKDRNFIEQTRRFVNLERRLFLEELSNIEWLHPYPSQTNFILVKSDIDNSILERYLLERGIIIRNCKGFEGLDESYIRLAVKDRKSNKKLIEVLRSFSNL
ncbi:MAG: threonine-phosphate decarboxylase CobD [bacterium]|nr:threonine-phosphate decarboxylase CobD [bacterium]